jgi:hypothetical protein
MSILARLWPLLTKAIQTFSESKTIVESSTKDTLLKLGQILGKDTSQLSNGNGFGTAPGGLRTSAEAYELQQQQNLIEMMMKEAEYLRSERAKDKRDIETLRRQLNVSHVR